MWKPSRLSKHINKRLGEIVGSSCFTLSALGNHTARSSALSKVGRKAATLSDLLSAAEVMMTDRSKTGDVQNFIRIGSYFSILTIVLGIVAKP